MNRDKKHIVAPEELMAFMDGQLEGERRAEVEKHLKACLECRSLLESLELAEREVAKAEKFEAPDGYFTTFASRVANRIAKEELAPARRPWLLRWGWMPAAAAAAFAAVMVLSHGFYEQPRVYEAALKRQVIPIPIAPEPRVPETVAVLESYYEEAPVTPAAGVEPSEKDRMAASGAARPAPPASSEVAEVSADEVSTVSRTRAASSPGLVDLSGAPSAPAAKEVHDAKGMTAGVVKRSAPETSSESVEKAQPPSTPAPLIEAKKSEPAKSDDRDKAELPMPPPPSTAKRRLVRIRQVGASRVLLPVEPASDSCPASEVAAVEAIVIHLPNGGENPPPEVGPAVRICLPQ